MSDPVSTAEVAERVIVPPSSALSLDIGEIWEFRSVFGYLAWRDIKVRYAQTFLGAAWAILQPLLATAVFTIVFGNFAEIPSEGLPYPVFALTALVPWTFFSTGLSGAGLSLVGNASLISKVYFPRLAIPAAPVAAALLDFAIAYLMLLLVAVWIGTPPVILGSLLAPLLIIPAILTCLGMGSWLAAVNLKYRDVRYVLPFLLQMWMYLSPVVYPLSMVPDRYRFVYMLNPLVGVIDGMRGVLFEEFAIPWTAVAISFTVSIILFIGPLFAFKRAEQGFADFV